MNCFICKKELVKQQKIYCSRKCCNEGHSIKSTGHRPYNWKGGKLVHKSYVYLLTKEHPNRNRDGYVTEHRLIMEKKLGRFLERTEIIHHINGISDDNRIENLELVNSQSEHMKIHHPKGIHIYKGEHPRGSFGKRWKIFGKKYPHRKKKVKL